MYMNKVWVVVMFLVLPLIFTLQVNAQDDYRFTDTEILTEVETPRFSVSVGFGSAFGVNDKAHRSYKMSNSPLTSIKVGYLLLEKEIACQKIGVEVQGEYSSINSFSRFYQYSDLKKESFLNFTNKMVNFKIFFPIKVKKVSLSPFLIFGTGRVKGEDSGNYFFYYEEKLIGTIPWKLTDNGIGYGLGGGIDLVINKNIFLFFEYKDIKTKRIELIKKSNPRYSSKAFGLGFRF